MFASEIKARAVTVASVHIDVMGWGDEDNASFRSVQLEIEGYVLDACEYGLSREEIEIDLQERFVGRLEAIEFQFVSTIGSGMKAVISADAFDRV